MSSTARRCFAYAVPALMLAACSDLPTTPGAPNAPSREVGAAAAVQLKLDTLERGLQEPLFVTAAPGDRRRLFIVEKGGRILVRMDGQLRAKPFLDLTGQVSDGSEQGLLGLAFHPDYAVNGRFFVNYTDLAGDTRVVEYQRATVNVADPASARLILTVDQPATNHNGGMMAFGPDGYLYIAFGDGGGSASRPNAQALNTLLGKIIRIDVDGAQPYAIPADNPFVGVEGARGEIWHLGLRNPWRFSFDRANGRMFIGDVGQNTYEEVNIVGRRARALNFGWPIMEGPACFEPATGCDTEGLRLPQHWYTQGADACSITGGYVYRGRAMPELRGSYFFADFCGGDVRSLRYASGTVTELTDWSGELGIPGRITSFGEDNRGELYLTTLGGGLFRIAPRP